MRESGLVLLGLLLSACSDSSRDERRVWNGDSVGIAFELHGPTGQLLCAFSAMREELTAAQLDGLSALMLHDAALRAGCDEPSYAITIHARDGSSASYRATFVDCESSPILLFEDFEAWAKSTPCSYQP